MLDAKELKTKTIQIGSFYSDITLVNTPPWGIDSPPTGIAYLSAYLEKKDIKTSVFDLNIFIFNNIDAPLKLLWHYENKNFWKNDKIFEVLLKRMDHFIDSAVEIIISKHSAIVGFSVCDGKERITIELIKRIKEKCHEKIIVLGGPACSTSEERELFAGRIPGLIDAFVLDDGEHALLEIVNAVRQGRELTGINGVLTYQNGKFSEANQAAKKEEDEYVYPTYRGFDIPKYQNNWLTVEWSRGCIADCTFCKIKDLWEGYYYREPQDIVNELEYHILHNKVSNFIISDPAFNGNIKKLEKVCDLIIKKKLRLQWCGQAIPSNSLTKEILFKMKESGMYQIMYGVESGSDTVLKGMRKPYTTEIIEKCLMRTFEVGIPIYVFLIVGYPGESEEEFAKTLAFIDRNRKYLTGVKSVNTLHLVDGTYLYNHKEKYGIELIEGKEENIFWTSDEGKNTYERRKEKARRLISLLEKLNLPILEENLFEGKEKEFELEEDLGYADSLELIKKNLVLTSHIFNPSTSGAVKVQTLVPKANFSRLFDRLPAFFKEKRLIGRFDSLNAQDMSFDLGNIKMDEKITFILKIKINSTINKRVKILVSPNNLTWVLLGWLSFFDAPRTYFYKINEQVAGKRIFIRIEDEDVIDKIEWIKLYR